MTEGWEQDQMSRDSQGEEKGFPRGFPDLGSPRAQPGAGNAAAAPEGGIPSRGLRGNQGPL